MRIGLTGGIGAGKSAVADVWRERGAVIVDADQLAREAVAPGTRGYKEIALRWPQVIAPDGTLDRAALARIVFADDDERAVLNGIVHPRVRALARAREAAAPAGALLVHVVPLLFEGEYWRALDATAVVIAPEEARIARVIERDGLDRASVLERMRAQIDPAEARRRATYVIDNDADLATLRDRANEVYDRLQRR
ncbi:MAG: dephospho-CoA kinase [Candidatus Lustribacter sp.]